MSSTMYVRASVYMYVCTEVCMHACMTLELCVAQISHFSFVSAIQEALFLSFDYDIMSRCWLLFVSVTQKNFLCVVILKKNQCNVVCMCQ